MELIPVVPSEVGMAFFEVLLPEVGMSVFEVLPLAEVAAVDGIAISEVSLPA